ncbi:hypothetical protein E3N88_28826 [Mikania micrantha]|uniref:Uncharacterized protein n=1 Tax=Mikania micrantha TaxID=192012 RepID=A0A5N6N3D6_9ASTR|nr:hypothetical protein E3N88_28826 [Mikania micrantha]
MDGVLIDRRRRKQVIGDEGSELQERGKRERRDLQKRGSVTRHMSCSHCTGREGSDVRSVTGGRGAL